MSDPITLIFLGDIAAGKGTQSKIIAEKYDLHLIDVGNYTRKVLSGRGKVSKKLEKVKLGKLAPSKMIQEYLKEEIAKLSEDEGILIDGGKMPAEAKLIYRLLKQKGREPLVIYISIPQKEIYRRLEHRYYDKKTGQPMVVDPDKVKNGKYQGKEVIKRADDDPEAIKNRIDYYKNVYSKTVDFWKNQGLLKKIDGNKSVSAVTKDIASQIKKRYGTHKK